MNRTCYLCAPGAAKTDLRPYGPRGEWVCFACAFATPERQAQTEQSFSAQLESSGPVGIIGEETGPRPATEIINHRISS